MKYTIFFILMGCALVLSACSSDDDTPAVVDTSRAAFSLYDDFSGAGIDGNNWRSAGSETSIGGMGVLRKITRVDPAKAGTSHTDSLTATASSPTSIQAKVNINSALYVGGGGETRSILELTYQPSQYRTINSTDFIYARAELRHRESASDQIRLFVQGCANADCTTKHQFGTADFAIQTVTSSLALATDYILLLAWVAGTTSFDLTVTDGLGAPITGFNSPVSVDMSAITAFDAANSWEAKLRTRVTGGSTSDLVSLTTDFDDVEIDGTPYDAFPIGDIDLTKWQPGNHTRVCCGGDVDITLTQSVRGGSNNLSIQNPNSVNAIRADVTVPDTTYIINASDSDSFQRARLAGYFYNDGTIGGEQTGSKVSDIWAEINVTNDTAYYLVKRITTADGSGTDDFISPGIVSVGAIALDTTNTLSIDWDGALFHFQLNSDTEMTFDPVAAGAPVAQTTPNESFKGIGVGIWMGTATQTHDGSLSATFDNVYTRP